MTIFEKIIAREIPAKIVWENDDAIAFEDVNPQAPVHVLIVPKKIIPRLAEAKDSDQAVLGRSTTGRMPVKAFRICTCIFWANARSAGRRVSQQPLRLAEDLAQDSARFVSDARRPRTGRDP